jgi:hypothetical protein
MPGGLAVRLKRILPGKSADSVGQCRDGVALWQRSAGQGTVEQSAGIVAAAMEYVELASEFYGLASGVFVLGLDPCPVDDQLVPASDRGVVAAGELP